MNRKIFPLALPIAGSLVAFVSLAIVLTATV